VNARVEKWLQAPFDFKTQKAVKELMENPQALADAFYIDLSFGTGGLRGIMGVGTNRMNIYTVRRATQGLANYILKHGNPKAGVMIGFDSRHHSEEFAIETARVLAGNQIPAFVLKDLRPTPFVSFACRTKHCQAAVMITASHNPKEYNGYKVYWSDGGQIVPPHDTGIMAEVEAIIDWNQIQTAPASSSLIQRINGALDDEYLHAIAKLSYFPDDNHQHGSSLKITYTSLHGTGIALMPRALESWGFKTIDLVEAQIFPNGDFPTVKYPNPESLDALKLGIEQMTEAESDILLATDPDADRLGVVVMHEGQPFVLNGNQIAAVCTSFISEASKKKGAFITSIVTTELVKKIAESHGHACFQVLTGFKYIGEKIHEWEETPGSPLFLFGAEESYGYLIGTHSRDKDAIVSGCLLAEIALHQKLQGKTVVDLLYDIYSRFGAFREQQLSLEFPPGKEGMKAISQIMQRLRAAIPRTLGGEKVMAFDDLLLSPPDGLPKSDVITIWLADGTRLVIRPSGTEPKLKVYAFAHEYNASNVIKALKQCDSRLETLLKILKTELS